MAGIDGFSDRDFERAEEAWSALDESLANARDDVEVHTDRNGHAYIIVMTEKCDIMLQPEKARKLLYRLAKAISTIDAHERAHKERQVA